MGKIEILSKDDTRDVFAMSKAQWLANVQRAGAMGAASAMTGTPETGVGMVVNTPDSDLLIVTPNYGADPGKPDFVQVSVGYREPRASMLSLAQPQNRSSRLHSDKDNANGCFANLRMANGDPRFISVAQTGVLVKKSRVGFFGATLYNAKTARDAIATATALVSLHPTKRTPDGMTNPVLLAFTNAILHCSTVADVVSALNQARESADQISG